MKNKIGKEKKKKWRNKLTLLISRKMEEAAWERTRHHLGNLEHWRQRSDMEQKGKYMDVEDAAGPLLMGRDAGPSFMKRGLYLDGTQAHSGDLSLKKKIKKKINLEEISWSWVLSTLLPLRESPFPVQPAGKPVSCGQNVGHHK